MDLKSAEYANGKPKSSTTQTIYYWLDFVFKKHECIQVGSNRIVDSPYYYIKTLFGKELPNFNISKLQYILYKAEKNFETN